jgi:hypothetical protein
MYDDRGLRYVGLFLLAAATAGFLIGVVGFFWPDLARERGPWLTAAAVGLAIGIVLGGDTSLKWRERKAEVEQKQTINYARYLANEERERRLNAPPKADKPAAGPDYRQAQAAAYHHFMQHGFVYGFTIRALARSKDDDNAPGKCVSEEDWREMREFLCAAGVLLGDARNTKLDRKWTRERWEQERHTLPYPNREAPKVSIYVHNTTTLHANNAPTAAEGV